MRKQELESLSPSVIQAVFGTHFFFPPTIYTGMRKQVLDSLSPSVIQAVFATHFPDTSHHTLVTLKPSWLTDVTSKVRIQLEALFGGRKVRLESVSVALGGGAVLAVSALVLFALARLRRR